MAKENGKTAPAKGKVDLSRITIPRLKREVIKVPIVGVSRLVCHAWEEKARKMMEDAQTGKARPKKEIRDPWMEFCSAAYWIGGMPENPTQKDLQKAAFGFPAVAFKKAIVSACRNVDGLTMTSLRGAIFVHGPHVDPLSGHDLVEIRSSNPPEKRFDICRIGMGTATPRYRPSFWPWSAMLEVEITSGLTAEQAIHLVEWAGFCVGVGENRPECQGGDWGRFRIDTDKPPRKRRAK